MGADKALLELDGKTLIERAVEIAGAAASRVFIVGDPERFLRFGPVIEDLFPGQGPLAGIHAALSSTKTDLNLVLAVDLPFIEAGLLKYLVSAASQSGVVITVPQADGGLQPLCAVYRREFAEVAGDALRRRRNKIDALFGQVETRVIAETELQRMGFSAGMFRNLNTPQDLEQAQHHFTPRGVGR